MAKSPAVLPLLVMVVLVVVSFRLPSNAKLAFATYPRPPVAVTLFRGRLLSFSGVLSSKVTVAALRLNSQSSNSVPANTMLSPTSNSVSPVGDVYDAFMSPKICTLSTGLLLLE